MSDRPRTVEEAEVVVVGAGPAGAVAAATLADRGRDVLLVDQDEFPRDKPCGDGLTHSAVEFLEELGLEEMVASGQPIEDCRIVVGHQNEMTGWYRPPARLPKTGLMRTMPRIALDNTLLDLALDRGARFLQARVDSPELADGQATGVTLTGAPDAARVAARCVIAADGATSRMRRSTGIGGEPAGTQVYAVRQYFDTGEALDPVFDVYVPLLYEGGLLIGYGWVFPVSERRANIGVALYAPPAGRPRVRIRHLLNSFVEELEQREGERFGGLTNPSKPYGAPIATQFSPDRCQLENVLFAGEAARAADPLTGEGISFALRSGEDVALAADEMLRGRRGDVGAVLGRRFIRLGQNLSLPGRLAIGLSSGLSLADREHQPFVMAVRRITGNALDVPSLADTPVSELLSRDPDCARGLEAFNDRALDSLRTTFPFALEVLHRELRSRSGPVGAAVALAVRRAVAGDVDDVAAVVAEAVELLGLTRACFPRMTDATGSDLARLNNSMGLLLGDFVLTQSFKAGSTLGSDAVRELGGAARRLSEGLTLELSDRHNPDRVFDRYFAAAEATSAGLLSLAAGLSATTAGAGAGTASALTEYGRELGLALRISDEIRDLTIGDQLTRRRPGSDIREGNYTLPVLHAVDADEAIRVELEGPVDAAGAASLVARVRDLGGIESAADDCRRHAALAVAALENARFLRTDLLEALAGLPVERLADAVPEAAGAAGLAHSLS